MVAELIAFPEGFSITIDKPIMLFGRDAECDIQFDSRKISRRHCCLAQVGDQLIVRDLGSTNGVRINGVRVLEGYLQAGDELCIGNHRYHVHWPAPAIPNGKGGQAAAPGAAARTAGAAGEPLDEALRLQPGDPVSPPQAPDAAANDEDMLPDVIPLAPSTDDHPAISPRKPPHKT